MKKIKYFVFLFALIPLMSFTSGKAEVEHQNAIYSFTRSGDTAPLIQLVLKDDGTFVYTDRANPNKLIEARGTYLIKNKQIKFIDFDSNFSIADSWKIDEKYNCIKSRKALKWTRICGDGC